MKLLTVLLKGESGVRHQFISLSRVRLIHDPNAAEKGPEQQHRNSAGATKRMTSRQLLLKEPLKEAWQGKQWWKKEASTLTCNPATLFFLVSDSSRSVNYWGTQRCLPSVPTPKTAIIAPSIVWKETFAGNFSTFVQILSVFPACFLSILRQCAASWFKIFLFYFLFLLKDSSKMRQSVFLCKCWMRSRLSALLWHVFFIQ